VLLGATWLVMKTSGELQAKALAWTRWGLAWVALGVALVSLATPLISETVQAKWFAQFPFVPRSYWLTLLPLATLAAGIWVWRATGRLKKDAAAPDWTAFAGAISIFALAFAGLAYSIFPYVVIDRITLWQAASHPTALKMVLIGVALVLPFLLGYTIFAHRVFRGKAQAILYE
jgi:cytochrome d ubiquinol oxidase subunit II